MATVYAHMQFTDPSGQPRQVGDQFELPRETDFDKAEFARLKEWGAIGDNPPAGAPDGDGEQRTSARDRRKSRSSSAEES